MIHSIHCTKWYWNSKSLTSQIWNISNYQEHIVVLYLLTQLLCSSNQKCSFSWNLFGYHKRCGRVFVLGSLPSSSIVSSQWPPSGASLSSLNGRGLVRLRLYLTTISGQIECTYIYRKTYKQHAILWCSESCDSTRDKMTSDNVRITAVRIRYRLSRCPGQRSLLLLQSPAALRRGLRTFRIGLFYKANLIASWMHLHDCRCF